jgi:hypothetical protein
MYRIKTNRIPNQALGTRIPGCEKESGRVQIHVEGLGTGNLT